jgi:hypothetical protein
VAVLGGDFDLLVDHGALLSRWRFFGFLPWQSYDCKETAT